MVKFLATSRSFVTVGAVSILLAACGGGGTGNQSATTSPQTTTTPPAQTNSVLTNLTVDQVFRASSAVISFDVASDGTTSNVSFGSDAQTAGNTVSYDNGAGGFNLSVSQNGVAFNQLFGASAIDSGASDTSFRVYSNTGGDFILLIPGDATYGQSYVTLGVWNSDTASSTQDITFGALAFGIETAGSSMPSTGSATYNGMTLGTLDAGNRAYRLTGDVQIDVNFASGSVNGAFSNMRQEDLLTSGVSNWRDFTAIGNISAGSSLFSGTATTNDSALTGGFAGGFYGPVVGAPREVGGTWSLSGSGESAVGSFVGKQ
jgi:hypothetical protein